MSKKYIANSFNEVTLCFIDRWLNSWPDITNYHAADKDIIRSLLLSVIFSRYEDNGEIRVTDNDKVKVLSLLEQLQYRGRYIKAASYDIDNTAMDFARLYVSEWDQKDNYTNKELDLILGFLYRGTRNRYHNSNFTILSIDTKDLGKAKDAIARSRNDAVVSKAADRRDSKVRNRRRLMQGIQE